jgi:hypothetical protein
MRARRARVLGYQTGQGLAVEIALAIGTPLLAAVVWGTFIAPHASLPVPTWLSLLLHAAIFECAAILEGHTKMH